MSIVLELPDRLLVKLKELSDSRNISLEEAILEAIYEYVEEMDPEMRSEMYLKLCEKYLRDAKELLSKGDYVQAGEKLWGAAAQIVKAVAARRGIVLDSHAKLWDFVASLRVELNDPDIGRQWSVANSLHKNFYEAQVSPELVKDYAEDVRKFVDKLKLLITK
ncbi:MAG: PaREP1 family protein [Aigarchaeota archaeon]|nr:PaREP1 family protein [Candidatus Pelearchaeum maunauluense]